SLFQPQWMFQMWRNCTAERYAVNKERMLRLSSYSQECLHQLQAETGIEFEGRRQGTLQVFRTHRQMEEAARDVKVLSDAGIEHQLLEASELATIEPALEHVRHKLVGGLRTPGDETGDCQLFTTRLTELAREMGVEFRYGETIQSLYTAGGRVT